MNNIVQLWSFAGSFLFGVAFALLNEFNNKAIKNKKPFLKIVMTFLFIIDISLLYLIMIYKINGGILHIYFLLCVLLGFMISFKKIKDLILIVKKRVKGFKIKRKML